MAKPIQTVIIAGIISAALTAFVGCGGNDISVPGQGTGPRVRVVQGEVVSPDSSTPPKVVVLDESKLTRVTAGNPTITPTNLNIVNAASPQIILAGNPVMTTPGTDSFTLPVVKPARDSAFFPAQPAIVSSLPFRMKDAAHYNIQYIDVDQGMNSSYVWKVVEDKSGYMWFATDGGGATRYDGKSFLRFTEKEGLASDYVRDIIQDRKSNIWFATNAGVTKYDGTTFTNYTKNDGLGNTSVWSALEDSKGNIWFTTYGGGISKYDGKSFTNYDVKTGLGDNSIWSVMEDKRGNLWFSANGGGLSKYDGKSFTHYTTKEGLISNIVYSSYEAKDGRIWIGTDAGISVFDGQHFVNYTTSEGLTNNVVKTFYEDGSGVMWIGTYGGGLMRFNGKQFTYITEKEGLSNNHVVSIHADETGTLWLGTYGGGVTRFNPNSFTHYTSDDGFFYSAWSIVEARDGRLWLGSYGDGVSVYDGRTFSHYTGKEGLSGNMVRTILQDHEGNLWFGCYGKGVTKYDGKTFTHFTENDGLSSNNVLVIREDKKGNIWFGTDGGGVTRFDGKEFTQYTTKQGLKSNFIRSVYPGENGNMWFGSNAGLSHFDGTTFTNYSDEMSFRTVWSINADNEGNTWFGTAGYGVIRYDGSAFTFYTEEEGLSNNSVWSIMKDSIGNFWMATEKGLNYFDVQSVKTNAAHPKIFTFHREDGLKAEDFILDAVAIDRNNSIWWGSGKSLTVLDLNNFRLNEQTPVVHLDNISIQEKFIDYRRLKNDSSAHMGELKGMTFSEVAPFSNYPDELVLPHSLNHLTFQFNAIDWAAAHNVRYQYQLEGLDQDWSQLSADNKADYRNVPYGTYTFKVRTTGGLDQWSDPVEYTFTILPPWWHTWWARTLGILLLVGMVMGYTRWRERVLQARQKELQSKVNEATAEIKHQKNLIEEKHKAITDSINYAERIQRSFLATKDLLDENLRDYFVLYLPKDVVSGDFYWASKLPNGRFALVTADSTGHGVPGAIMSLLNITSLEKAIENESNPAQVLNLTRNIIVDRLRKDGTPEGGYDGMDCSIISFDFHQKHLQIAAANNPVWILRDRHITEIKPDRFPVGKHEKDNQSFTCQEFKFEPGDMIYTMTDGFADQFGGPSGKKYKWKHLQKFIASIAHEPMDTQKEKLRRAFADWKENLEQVDDICIIGVRISQV